MQSQRSQLGSTGDAIDKGGIVAGGAGSVNALRYGPDMQQIFGRRTEEFDAGGTVEPRFETIAGKKYRHALHEGDAFHVGVDAADGVEKSNGPGGVSMVADAGRPLDTDGSH